MDDYADSELTREIDQCCMLVGGVLMLCLLVWIGVCAFLVYIGDIVILP